MGLSISLRANKGIDIQINASELVYSNEQTALCMYVHLDIKYI